MIWLRLLSFPGSCLLYVKFFMSQCLTNGRFVFWNNRVVHGNIVGAHVCPEYIKHPSLDGGMDR